MNRYKMVLFSFLGMIFHFSLLCGTEGNFSPKEIKMAAKLSYASYNHPDCKKELDKLCEKGWIYSYFHSKTIWRAPCKVGLIAFSPEMPGEKQKIIIAFRGTENITDIKASLSFRSSINPSFGQSVRVHSGFFSNSTTSLSDIKSIIMEYCQYSSKSIEDFDIIVTGHSLGGAVATLAGMQLLLDKDLGLEKVNNSLEHKIRALTFGSPRIGDATFKEEYDKIFGAQNHFRFTFKGDLIPALPFERWGYVHVGTEVGLHSDLEEYKINYWSRQVIRKSILNHSMFTYRKIIKEYLLTSLFSKEIFLPSI